MSFNYQGRDKRAALRKTPSAKGVKKNIGTSLHGSRTGYAQGCRCEECTKANAAYSKERYHARKSPDTPPDAS